MTSLTPIPAKPIRTTPLPIAAFGGLSLDRVIGFHPHAPVITATTVEPSLDFMRRESDSATPVVRHSIGTLDAKNGAALAGALESLVKAGLPATAPGPLPTDTPYYTLGFTWNGTKHELSSSYPSTEFRAVIQALDAGVAAGTRATSR